MEVGYIKLWRKIRESNLWPTGKYSKLEAFEDLILSANGKEKKWQGILIKRGEFITSQLELSKRWRWSISTVNEFLKAQKIETRIETRTNRRHTHIIVLKYEQYNPLAESKIETYPKPNRNLTETTNECNERNEDNKDIQCILDLYNSTFGKKTISPIPFEDNAKYWLEIYSIEDIKKAITVAKNDKWWKDKFTLVKLFRKKNTQGEKVDYIGDLSSREIEKKGYWNQAIKEYEENNYGN